MLSAKILTQGSAGSRNVVQYMKATEYYRAGNEVMLGPARWAGDGALILNLEEGPQTDAQFEKLLMGVHPLGDQGLTKNANQTNRRMGIDLTFTTDKTASILLAIAGPEERQKIMDAHRQAVNSAMAFLLGEAHSRTGAQGTGKKEPLTGPVMRQVDHFDSREGDPNLHTHCVLLNLNRCQDGKWRSIEMEPLFQAKHAAGALYRAHMAEGLKALGYAVESTREQDIDERETGQVWHKVAGIGRDVARLFSKRRQAIEKAMIEEGLGAQEATLRTRQGKKDLTAEEVALTTIQTLDELKSQGRIAWSRATEIKATAQAKALEPKAQEELLAGLHKTDSFWSRYHLIDLLAKEGHTDAPDRAQAWIKQGMESGEIIELKDDDQGRGRYCSKTQWDLEQHILDNVANRAHDSRFKIPAHIVERAIKIHEAKQGFSLSQEQRDMVTFATQQNGGMLCLVGRAGTGKTASAGCYIEAYKQQGFQILGASTAQRAAEKLASETGLSECHSVAKLLQKIEAGELVLTSKTILIVDEAGMVGASSLARLQALIDATQGKMLLLGDPLQLQPVEAGSPFRLIIKDQGAAELTEIRRQKNEAERQIAMNFYGGKTGAEIVDEWVDLGMLQTRDTRKEATAALIEAYLANETDHAEKLILANTRADVTALTHALREALKDRGELTQPTLLEIAGTKLGEKIEKEFCIGDRIAITKNHARLGLANGDRGIIQNFETTRAGTFVTMALQSDVPEKNGKVIRLNLSTFDRIDHAWANTNHAAQGQGKDHVFWLASAGPNLDRNMAMVAFTRTKKTFQNFCSQDHLSRIKDQIQDWGEKKSAQEMGKPQEEKPQSLADTFKDRWANATDQFFAVLEQRNEVAEAVKTFWQNVSAEVQQLATLETVVEWQTRLDDIKGQITTLSAKAVPVENERDRVFNGLRHDIAKAEAKAFHLMEGYEKAGTEFLGGVKQRLRKTETQEAIAERDTLYDEEKRLRKKWDVKSAHLGGWRNQQKKLETEQTMLENGAGRDFAIAMRVDLATSEAMEKRVGLNWREQTKNLGELLTDAVRRFRDGLQKNSADLKADDTKKQELERNLSDLRRVKALGLASGPRPPTLTRGR